MLISCADECSVCKRFASSTGSLYFNGAIIHPCSVLINFAKIPFFGKPLTVCELLLVESEEFLSATRVKGFMVPAERNIFISINCTMEKVVKLGVKIE